MKNGNSWWIEIRVSQPRFIIFLSIKICYWARNLILDTLESSVKRYEKICVDCYSDVCWFLWRYLWMRICLLSFEDYFKNYVYNEYLTVIDYTSKQRLSMDGLKLYFSSHILCRNYYLLCQMSLHAAVNNFKQQNLTFLRQKIHHIIW